MLDIEIEDLAKKRGATYIGLKNEVRKKLLENTNSSEAKLIINHIIKAEQEHSLYNELEWKEVLQVRPGVQVSALVSYRGLLRQ